jgi:hypothetical protein
MSARRKGVAVLAVQLVLILSIAVKYAWERHTSPMVWTRAEQYDPAQPIRGRYIALSLHASACGLSHGSPVRDFGWNSQHEWASFRGEQWRVVPAVRGGVLMPQVVPQTKAGPTQELTLARGLPCEYARLSGTSDFFVPEHAASPFPLAKGKELWALVTVPPSGPVRPVKLAISDATGFHVLRLE